MQASTCCGRVTIYSVVACWQAPIGSRLYSILPYLNGNRDGRMLRVKHALNRVPCAFYTGRKRNFVTPTKAMETVHIHELARSAIRLGCVEDQLSTKTNCAAYQLRKFAYGHIFSSTDVDKRRSVLVDEGFKSGRVKILIRKMHASARSST